MKKLPIYFACLIGTLYLSTLSTQGQTVQNKNIPKLPLFQNGETVVFLGNSITRGGDYLTYIKLYYLTRFPEMTIKIVNTGVSGHTSIDGINRFYQDVMVHQPDKIAMMFGMNDANTGVTAEDSEEVKEKKLKERIEFYRQNMDSITRMINHEGVELIYIAPSIYDDKVQIDREIRYGGNKAIGMCRDVVYELASKYQKSVVDFYTIMNEVNAKYQKEDPKFTVVSGDRVHPQREGNLLMGYQFLKSQDAPSIISHAEIDAAEMKIQNAQNCKVTNLSKTEKQYFFSIKSKALPFPIENNKASKWKPMHKEFNQELLFVKGLEQGKYELSIDGKKIDEFTNEQLQQGINLADFYHTPQYGQAVMLRDLVFRQRALISDKLRALAIFDYGMLKEIPRTAPNTTIRAKMDAELEKLKEKSYYSYLVNQSHKYMIYKSLVKETETAIEDLEQSLNVLKKPLTHMYVLNKLDD